MAVRRTLTVSSIPEQDAPVRSCPPCGRYAGASEVVPTVLRLLGREDGQRGVNRLKSLEDGVTADA